jgi:hypothetical protein
VSKQKFVTVVTALMLVLFVCIPAMAEEEGYSPGPFLAADGYAAEKGEFGVFLDPEYYSHEEATEGVVGLTLEYAPIDRLLVELIFEAFKWVDIDEADVSESGIGDLAVGLKYGVYHTDSTHLALGFEYVEPTGDEDKHLSGGVRVGEPYIGVSQDLSSGASIHGSIAYGIIEGEEESEAGVALSYVHPLSHSMAFMVEAEMMSNEWLADGHHTEGMAGAGIAYECPSGYEIAGEALAGLTDESADWAILLSIGKEFELGGGHH